MDATLKHPSQHQHRKWNASWMRASCVLFLCQFFVDVMTGAELKMAIFVPVNCSSSFSLSAEGSLSLAATDLGRYEYTKFVNITTNTYSTCDESDTLMTLVNMFSRRTHDVIIGPGLATLCEPTARLGQHWDIPVVSWACSSEELARRKEYSTFTRTVPSNAATANAMSSVLNLFKWKYSVIFASEISPWRELCKNVFFTLNQNNLIVESYLEMQRNFTSGDVIDAILSIKKNVKGE